MLAGGPSGSLSAVPTLGASTPGSVYVGFCPRRPPPFSFIFPILPIKWEGIVKKKKNGNCRKKINKPFFLSLFCKIINLDP